MEYLVPIFCLLLLVCLVFCIGYPLVGAAATPFGVREGEQQRLMERREQLLTAIKEIDFDQAMGKLPEGEYQHLRQQLETETMGVLHLLDEFKSQAGKGGALEGRIENDILALRQRAKTHCPTCGATRRQTDLFCAHCGAPFKETGAA